MKRTSFQQEAAREVRFREKRRSVRLNCRVPVAIESEEDGQAPRREEGHTCVVGSYGCLSIFSANLGVDQRVRLTNLATGRSNPAVVVWKGSERDEGWEIGIELIDPDMDFWGLDL